MLSATKCPTRMSVSGLNAGKRSSPPALVPPPTVSGLVLVALFLKALVPGMVAGLLLQGLKYPLASGSGIVAMIKPTSVGLDRSSVRTSTSSVESSTPFLSCLCDQNGRALCASLFASGKCSRYSFSHSVSSMACRFFSTFYNLSTHLVLYAMNSSSAFNSLSSAR
jgi:hypothetical protein